VIQPGKIEKVFMKLLMAANRVIVLCLLLSFGAAIARAQGDQGAKIQIDHLNKLAERAEQVVEVTLDERLLQMASKFLSSSNPTEAKVKEIVSGLKGVYVRVFEFAKSGEYTTSDLESIRSQLRQPGWQKIVGVYSRGDNVDVHLRVQNDLVVGMVIIAAERTELTFVNIVGPIDLEKVRQLEGQLGIPKLDLKKR
jgi:hypothetical protein